MKIGVLLSGSGVYDGAEIHESVLSMLAITELGHDYQCISINKEQHHVVNHLTGEEMDENRNMMIEAARIARGNVIEAKDVDLHELDALVIPGGFGSAKNFTTWAFEGPEGSIQPEVKLLLVNMVNIGKPIAAICVSPVVLAKAFEDSDIKLNLTLGSTGEGSPYDINGFHSGVESVGAATAEKTVREVLVDNENKIVTAPCYMMDATILDIRNNTRQAIEALVDLVE